MEESLFSKELIQCPVCLNEEDATIWSVINAVADPDLKEKLLRKELQAQQCSNCSNTWILARPLLYRDSKQKLLIFSHPGQSEKQARVTTKALPALKGWNLRLVPDTNQMIEKIHIADSHLDDRLIEVIKLAVISQGMEDKSVAIRELHFLAADEKTLRFVVGADDDQWYTLDVESQIYKNAKEVIAGSIASVTGKWQVIDQKYAKELLEKIS